MFVVPVCYLLMIGIGFAIPVGMIIFEKLSEGKLARMSEGAAPSHKFRT